MLKRAGFIVGHNISPLSTFSPLNILLSISGPFGLTDAISKNVTINAFNGLKKCNDTQPLPFPLNPTRDLTSTTHTRHHTLDTYKIKHQNLSVDSLSLFALFKKTFHAFSSALIYNDRKLTQYRACPAIASLPFLNMINTDRLERSLQVAGHLASSLSSFKQQEFALFLFCVFCYFVIFRVLAFALLRFLLAISVKKRKTARVPTSANNAYK